MKTVALLVVFALVCSVFAQRVDKVVLDTYETSTPPLIILLDETALPQTATASTSDASIIGGERDLILTAEDGPNNSILTSGVSGGQWSVAAPHSSSGFSIMQYDGIDGSPNLNKAGLTADLSTNGADSLHLILQADQDTEYTVTLYSGSSTSSATVDVPGDQTSHDYYILFTQFQGSANLNSVGAIEVRVEMFVDVDAFISLFATAGPTAAPPPPGVSPTPTPEVGTFWYTFDDDDEGRSPCGDEPDRKTFFLADDNVIYYYFYGLPDDGDNGSSFVGANGAAGLTASIALLIVTIVTLF